MTITIRDTATIAGPLLIACILLGPTPLPAQKRGEEPPWPNDPAVLLKLLRQRDAEFDNRSVETEQRWVEKVSPRAQVRAARFNAQRFGQPDPAAPAEDKIPEDFDQVHRLRHLLTVREPEVTLERIGDLEPMKHPQYVALPNKGCRWSTAGGIERVWSPETNTLHIQGAPSPDGLLRWNQHTFEWSCGYGLAKWLRSIDSLRVDKDRLIVQGKLRVMAAADSAVEFQLDRDLIVRRAVISVAARDGGSNEFVVETRGAVRPKDCPPVAQSGKFRRILKPVGKPEAVYQEYDVEFVSASARLSDEQYAERTRIEAKADATVIDMRPKR